MEITDLIKESFVFPSKDLGKLAIYIVITVVISGLGIGGVLTGSFSINNGAAWNILTVILFICALILGFILNGYSLTIVNSGIKQSESLPEYQWKENLISGVKYFILNIVYFIIPAIIIFIVGMITNVPGNIYAVLQQSVVSSVNGTIAANATAPAANALSATLTNNLLSSVAITAAVGIIVLLIFSFIQTMAMARLAKTDSLGQSLHIIEAFKDIGRIGYGKVIAVVILIAIISIVINAVLGIIFTYIPQISIISIIIAPYLAFFSSRAIGLLYSDIA